MAAPDDMPPWRANLLAVPPDQRSAYQRDLIRGLELADYVKEEMKTGIPTNLDDPHTVKILAAGVEASLLGSFDYSAILLLPQDVQKSFENFVMKMNTLGRKLVPLGIKGTTVPASQVTAAILAQAKVGVPNAESSGEIVAHYRLYDKLIDVSAAAVDDELAACGSNLTAATLKETLDFCCSLGRMFCPQGYNDIENAVNMVIKFSAEAAHSTVPTWKILASYKIYCTTVETFSGPPTRIKSVLGVQMSSKRGRKLIDLVTTASDACVRLLERMEAVSESAGDSGLLALILTHKIDLFMNNVVADIDVAALKAAGDKAVAALAAARPWLPKTHRKTFSTDYVEEAISELVSSGGVYILSDVGQNIRIIKGLPGSSFPPLVNEVNISFDVHGRSVPLRSCAWCGAESRELLACAGCRCVFFCN